MRLAAKDISLPRCALQKVLLNAEDALIWYFSQGALIARLPSITPLLPAITLQARSNGSTLQQPRLARFLLKGFVG